MSMTGLSYVIGNTEMIEASDKPTTDRTRTCLCSMTSSKTRVKCTSHLRYRRFTLRDRQSRNTGKKEKKASGLDISLYGKLCKGLDRLGFKTIIPRELQSKLVISVLYPNDPNWDFAKVHDYVYERGFTIYPGKVSDLPTFRLFGWEPSFLRISKTSSNALKLV